MYIVLECVLQLKINMRCTKLYEKLSIKYHLIHSLKPSFTFAILTFTSHCDHDVIISDGRIRLKRSL